LTSGGAAAERAGAATVRANNRVLLRGPTGVALDGSHVGAVRMRAQGGVDVLEGAEDGVADARQGDAIGDKRARTTSCSRALACLSGTATWRVACAGVVNGLASPELRIYVDITAVAGRTTDAGAADPVPRASASPSVGALAAP